MCPASFDSTMVPRTFEPRASKGGRFGKNLKSELTVKSVGPEELPAMSFSSGNIRITTPAGMYAGHSVTVACATTANWAKNKKAARQTEEDFMSYSLWSVANRESGLHSGVLSLSPSRYSPHQH